MQLIECPALLEYLENDPRSVLCLDIETTGFFAPDDEILSLSIIDGTDAVRFHSYFCPEHNDRWPEAEAVNGISPASVRQAPPLRERKAEIDELLASAQALVGYNLCSFDLPFMEASGICSPDTAVCDVMLDYAFVNHEWDDGHGDWKWQKLTACAANYNYPYQAHNSLEDAKAKPSANFVASRTAFKDMGYDLKPGQWKYPAWIIRPETKTLFVTADGVVADIKCATAQEKADIRDGKIPTEKFTYFRAAKVYEIGQTTCPAKDYPQILGHGIDDQQHKELYTRLQAVAGMSGFIVSEEPLPSSEFGYCSHDKRIVISDSLGDTQKLATLNHEFAHGLLHLTSDLSPAVEEFEAESVALIMQQRLGLPVEDLTVQYVKNALREAGNLPEFSMEESLGRIVKQANYVCDRLELQRIQQQEVMPVQNQTPVIQAQPNFGLTL